MRRLLVQLPMLQVAGCLGVAARMHGVGDSLALDVLSRRGPSAAAPRCPRRAICMVVAVFRRALD
jgi:hypothetical protein